jgi:hypothetical protein
MTMNSSRARRLLGGLAVGATVLGAVTFAGAGTGLAATGSLTLNYTCPFPLLGAQDMTVKVQVDGLPDSAVVGEPTAEAAVTATATVGSTPTWGLNLFGAKTIDGTGTAVTLINNAGTTSEAAPVLAVPTTAVPATGTFDAVATGVLAPITFANAGTTTYSVGNFSTTLTPRKADGSLTGLGTLNLTCTLKAGQNTLLHTVQVG